MKKVHVGIDLGTTYSAVSTFSKETGTVQVYRNSLGKECTPSVLCMENGKVLIGEDAKNEQKMGNVNSIACYKSMMGDESYTAYIDGEEYSAEALSGIFLRELVRDICQTNQIEIDGAVITVPAYFSDKQREATIRAGKAAGLRVLKIINEPTAAIIAYGLTDGRDKNVMVYDLGGGTFDVTIAHVSGTQIDVLATNGNHQLGGQDWDRVLFEEVREKFQLEYDVDINHYEEECKELMVRCEEAKKRLSSVSSTVISIQCAGCLGKYEISREDFENKTYYTLLKQTLALIEECFRELTLDQGKTFGWADLDEVVLVGGSTRMPQIRRMILEEYGKQPVTKDIDVDTIVSVGAAMQAELCVSQTITLAVAGKASAKPGQGAPVMSLTIRNSDIKDITSHSLGMIALKPDGKSYCNSIIIRKNSKVNEIYSRDYTFGGEKLQVYVLQGETEDLFENQLIGAYSITGMPKGEKSRIRVDFLYNTNGVVEVYAQLADGTKLSAQKEAVTETIDQIIARLEREKKEAEEAAKRASRVEVMLMIDTSGSMYGSMEKAHDAARGFVDQFNLKQTYISVVGFADRTEFACRWSNDLRRLHDAINSISVGYAGGGNDETPIKNNYQKFTSRQYPRVIVILTDGHWYDQPTEEQYAEIAKKDGIIIYGIGIGSADENFLNTISSGKGKKVDISQLSATFKEVADSIATEVGGNTLK